MAQQRTGKWVEQILKENGMTKSDLCEQTGLSKETVERLLKDGEATKEVLEYRPRAAKRRTND